MEHMKEYKLFSPERVGCVKAMNSIFDSCSKARCNWGSDKETSNIAIMLAQRNHQAMKMYE